MAHFFFNNDARITLILKLLILFEVLAQQKSGYQVKQYATQILKLNNLIAYNSSIKRMLKLKSRIF